MELIDRILSDGNIEAAIHAVKSNRGAAGIDKMTVDALEGYFAEHGKEIKEQIRAKKYQPQPVRRVYIPKVNGKQRPLGIPTVVDRVIQQAVAQVLSKGYESYFSEYSYGFRPNRDCHKAIEKVLEYLNEGCEWVVDLDIEKYFDTVNHDKLVSILRERIKDAPTLHLIRSFLKAGVMEGGLVSPTTEGVPQGGPLSPVLSNVYLDKFDKELESRGLRFVRYADDCNIFVRSEMAADRVIASVSSWLERKLRLKVNASKDITKDYVLSVGETLKVEKDGHKITVKAPSGLEGYKLSETTASDVTTYTLVALSYTITFDTDGGSKIDAIKRDFGTAVKAPKDPTKAGYTFKGWSPELPKTMPAKDLTVKAQWTANQYTITFDNDGGSEVDAIKQAFGTEVKAPADPTKEGYTFQGWNPELPKTMPAKNLTVKAQWKANGYTVAFDKNGGTGAMAAESFTYDAEQKLTANAFTRRGYIFTGWNTKADGSGQAYADQQSVKNLSAEDGATVTLYAQWSKDTAPSMMLAIATASGRTAMRVKWTKVKGADGYDVFMSKCGASEFRRVGSVKASASRVVTVRKLERSTEYKFYVKAWTRKNGKKTYIVTSPTAHALTGGANARYTNPSKVSVKRSSYTLKVGKTATIRATVTGLKKGKEVLNHVGLVRYITSNAKVAKVNSKGKIVAKGKGTCFIYVIATNGVYAKVKVTVK